MEFDKKTKQIGAAAVAAVALGTALIFHERLPKLNLFDGMDDALARQTGTIPEKKLQSEFKDLVQLQRSYKGSSAMILPLDPLQLPIAPQQTSIQDDLSDRFMRIIERLKHGSSGLK